MQKGDINRYGSHSGILTLGEERSGLYGGVEDTFLSGVSRLLENFRRFFARLWIFFVTRVWDTVKEKDVVDVALVQALRDGDPNAFQWLYLHYVENIQRFLTLLVRDAEAGREITQNIFTSLWERREKIDPNSNIIGYLYTIARNSAFKYLEHLKVERKFYREASHTPVSHVHSDGEFMAKETELLVELAINRMPEQRKKIFSMFFYDSLPADEISKKLNLKRSTVETHLALARKDIKNML